MRKHIALMLICTLSISLSLILKEYKMPRGSGVSTRYRSFI